MKKAEINIEGKDKAEEVEEKNEDKTLETEEIKDKLEVVEEKVKEEKKKEGKYRVIVPFYHKKRYKKGVFADFTKKEAEELLKEELIEEV